MSREIKLTQGKTAIVDDEDYEWLVKFTWHARYSINTWYAVNSKRTKGKSVDIQMHRLILGAKHDEQGDHRNHNGLDNRRSNIRIATHSQNMTNVKPRKYGSSRYKGVSFFKRGQNWVAYINKNYKRKHLGYFLTEIEAAKAYDAAAIKYHGDFALTNAQVFGAY